MLICLSYHHVLLQACVHAYMLVLSPCTMYTLICLRYHHVPVQAGVHALCLSYYVLLQAGVHAYMSVLSSRTTTSWCTCLYDCVIIM